MLRVLLPIAYQSRNSSSPSLSRKGPFQVKLHIGHNKKGRATCERNRCLSIPALLAHGSFVHALLACPVRRDPSAQLDQTTKKHPPAELRIQCQEGGGDSSLRVIFSRGKSSLLRATPRPKSGRHLQGRDVILIHHLLPGIRLLPAVDSHLLKKGLEPVRVTTAGFEATSSKDIAPHEIQRRLCF